MTKSWNHNPDVKKRQDFLGGQKRNSDGPFSAFDQCQTLQCRSPVVPQRLAVESRSRLGARGSGRPGPGWVGPPPTGRVARRRRRDSGARGAGAVLPETSNDSPKFLRVASERNKRPTGTAGTQAQLTGPSGWSAAGAARRAHTNPSRRPTNDTGTMRQCPRSPDTTTAQADKPQPIPMKPSGKQHALLKVSALGTP